MSLRKPLGYSLQQFGKHPFLMLACCAIPHAIGIALLLTFLRIDTSPYAGDVRLTWQALSPLTKALVFLMIPLNSWLPFALGQVGVTRIAQLERNGDAVLAGEVVLTMLRSALKILPLFFFLTFVWAIGVQVILVPGLLIAWQIGFAPMIIAVQNPDAWQAVKASSRIAGQTSAQSLTLWTFASFLIAITLILRAVILHSGPALSIQYGVGMGIFLVVIAAIEAVLNGALAGMYLSSQPARTSSASAAA